MRNYLVKEMLLQGEFAVLTWKWNNIIIEKNRVKKASFRKDPLRPDLVLINGQMRLYENLDELMQQADILLDAGQPIAQISHFFPDVFICPVYGLNLNHLSEISGNPGAAKYHGLKSFQRLQNSRYPTIHISFTGSNAKRWKNAQLYKTFGYLASVDGRLIFTKSYISLLGIQSLGNAGRETQLKAFWIRIVVDWNRICYDWLNCLNLSRPSSQNKHDILFVPFLRITQNG